MFDESDFRVYENGPLARSARASQLLDTLSNANRHEQVVGDVCDLLGFTPRALELRELTVERTTFGFFMQRHLERQSLNARQAEEAILPSRVAPH